MFLSIDGQIEDLNERKKMNIKVNDTNFGIDWVSDTKFSELTGIPANKLRSRRKKWPENRVWIKEGKIFYYSLQGFYKWMNEQSQKADELISSINFETIAKKRKGACKNLHNDSNFKASVATKLAVVQLTSTK